jgi:hypothetical protein
VYPYRFLLAGGLSLALAGCAAATTGVTPGSTDTNNSAGNALALAPGSESKQETLYALNTGSSSGTIAVYTTGDNPVRTVTLSGSSGAPSRFYMATSVNGSLYAEYPVPRNGQHEASGMLDVFGAKGKTLVASVKLSNTYSLLATDKSGDVFTLATHHLLREYNNAGSMVREINVTKAKLRNPRAIAADDDGDVAALNLAQVFVFPPGASQPNWTITGFNDAMMAAFDHSGNLYVASGYTEGVEVYAPAGSSPIETITGSVSYPIQICIDTQNNLYVLNSKQGTQQLGFSITEYRQGQNSPSRTITSGLDNPSSIAVDALGNLYVANTTATGTSSGNIAMYPPGRTTPKETITAGLQNPTAISVSP